MSDAHRYLRRVAFGALMTALLFSSPGCCPSKPAVVERSRSSGDRCCPQPTAEVSLR